MLVILAILDHFGHFLTISAIFGHVWQFLAIFDQF